MATHDAPDQLVLVIAMRKTISGVDEPPVTELLETNILGILSQLFSFPDNCDEVRAMKLESLWILTNLAYGDEDDIVKLIDPHFGVFGIINLVLSGDDHAMIEQIFWLVGNISGENSRFRDLIVANTTLMDTFLRLIERQKISRYLLRTLCWVNSNIFRFKGFPTNHAEVGLKVARAGLFSEDSDILSDCLWTISYLLDTDDDDRIGYIAQQDLIHKVVDLMGSKDLCVYIPSLRVMGNILSASDPAVIERCLWANVLDQLTNLLYQTNHNLVKESLWALSNISAGPCSHVERLVHSDVFNRVQSLTTSPNIDIRKEATFVMCNAVTGSDFKIRTEIYEKTSGGVLRSFLKALRINDFRLIINLLEGIEELLKLDEVLGTKNTDQAIAYALEQMDGLDTLDEVMKHPSMDVYNRCNEILTKYFDPANAMDMVDINSSM